LEKRGGGEKKVRRGGSAIVQKRRRKKICGLFVWATHSFEEKKTEKQITKPDKGGRRIHTYTQIKGRRRRRNAKKAEREV